MAQPQLKTSDLIIEIKTDYKVGKMDYFTFNRFLRKIEEIKGKDASDAYHIEGVLRSIYDPKSPEKSLSNFEKALRLDPNEPVLWSNYSVALTIFRRHTEAAEAAKKSMDILLRARNQNSPLGYETFETIVQSALYSVDFIEAKRMTQEYIHHFPETLLQNDRFLSFLARDDEKVDAEMTVLSDIYKQLIDREQLKLERFSCFVMPQGDCIVKLYLDTDNDAVYQLNNAAMEAMMERDFLPERLSIMLVKAC